MAQFRNWVRSIQRPLRNYCLQGVVTFLNRRGPNSPLECTWRLTSKHPRNPSGSFGLNADAQSAGTWKPERSNYRKLALKNAVNRRTDQKGEVVHLCCYICISYTIIDIMIETLIYLRIDCYIFPVCECGHQLTNFLKNRPTRLRNV